MLRSNIAVAHTRFAENQAANLAARQAIPASMGSDFYPNRHINQLWVNTFFTPDKNFDIGIEYTYGKRETFNNEIGKISRLTAMARYRFE